MALTPEEQRELDELEYEKLLAEKQSALGGEQVEVAEVSTPEGQLTEVSAEPDPLAPEPEGQRTLTGFVQLPQKILGKMARDAEALKQIGWQDLGAKERLELMALSFPAYLAREILPVAEGGAKRAVPAAVGQMVGRVTKIPSLDRVLGALGGAAGEAWALSGENQPITAGKLVNAGIAGATRGNSARGAGALAKEAAKDAGVNLAGTVSEAIVDQRPISAEELAVSAGAGAAGSIAGNLIDSGVTAASARSKSLRDSVEDRTISRAKENGYVFIPSRVSKGESGSITDYFSGTSPNSSAAANLASMRNQDATDNLIRKYIKAPKDMPFNEINMARLFSEAEKPYGAVASISPQAANSLELWKQGNADAKKAWRAYDRNPSPELREFAKENEDLAELAMDDIIQEARNAGKPGLVSQLEKARVEVAKLHLVDRSINYGNGHVSAKTFGNAVDNKLPITDEADIVGRMNLAFPGITRDVSSITEVGSGKIPVIDAFSRRLALSPVGQSLIERTNPELLDFSGELARQGTMEISRNPASDDFFSQGNPFERSGPMIPANFQR